jgi:hypothetical protein
MQADISAELTAIRARPLEDAYLVWFSAEHESGRALRAWLTGTGPGQEAAYAAYRAALDREEAAARDLERRLRAVYPS